MRALISSSDAKQEQFQRQVATIEATTWVRGWILAIFSIAALALVVGLSGCGKPYLAEAKSAYQLAQDLYDRTKDGLRPDGEPLFKPASQTTWELALATMREELGLPPLEGEPLEPDP